MNILIFSPVKIYPADAGSRIRIFNFIYKLKELGHILHYVYYSQDSVDKLHFDFMQDLCNTFSVIIKKKKILQKTGNYTLDEWYENNIHLKINELVKTFNIDTVLTNYIFHSKFLDFLPSHVYKIIDTHDRFTDRYKLFSDKKEVKYTWHSYSKEDEAKALNRADIIIAITDEENRYFSSISNTNITTIGHIEDKKYLNLPYKEFKRIGFIGGANQVNVIAINGFLEEFYKTSQYAEKLSIVIAGRICDKIKYKHKNIELLGLVENIEEFYNHVDLVINPLTFGTGQKIKSIEAIAYGVPIISTKVGFEGIESNEDFHKLYSLTDMIETIDAIAEQPERLLTMAKSSQNIFNKYTLNLNDKVNDIFKSEELSIVDNNLIIKYKQEMQKELDNIIIKDYQNKIKKQNIKLKKYETILKAIKNITDVSFFKHPIKKYQLYKTILKAYYA